MIGRLLPLLILALLWCSPVHAQGCGPSNPNCVVPTAPDGTNDNRAASTAFARRLATTVCVPFTSTVGGCVPASGGGTTNFLRADGTWAAPPGGSGALTVGTTTITSGTSTRVLYDNAGVLGEYTNTQLTALINAFTSTLSGAAPASGGGTTNFLRADATWAAATLAVGTNPVTGGTTTRVLYDNAGALGEYTNAQLTALCQAFTSLLSGCVPSSSGGTVNFLRADATFQPVVTSVGLSMPGIFSVTGSPVTTTGTLTASLANQNANLVWAGPASGAAAAPTFRSIVTADLPAVAEFGRLTYITHTPVMGTTVAAATTIYYDCFDGGGAVPFYNGTIEQLDPIQSCEVSTALQNSGTGVLNANGVFDVWWVHGGANRICVATNGTGGGWASDIGGSNTARGTGYTQIDRTSHAFETNTNSITHCYNGATDYGPVSANQATFLGTFATTGSSGTTSFQLGSSNTGGAQAAFIYLWNAHRRQPISTTVTDTTNTWTIAPAAGSGFNPANGSTGNRASFVLGLTDTQPIVHNSVRISLAAAAGGFAQIGIGIDSTSTPTKAGLFANPSANVLQGTQMTRVVSAGLSGVHFFQDLEAGDATNTQTFVGNTYYGFIYEGTY